MTARLAHAKINLALVVGPVQAGGKHEVVTVLQRVALADTIELSLGTGLTVEGFAEDTIVARALTRLASEAGVAPDWAVRITKEIPVAAGLGGGSSDAATALLLANDSLDAPLPLAMLSAIAAEIGADVPFFLREGPQLGTGDGSRLTAVDLPEDFSVVLVLPHDVRKESTASVYAAFDERGGAVGFDERRAMLRAALAARARRVISRRSRRTTWRAHRSRKCFGAPARSGPMSAVLDRASTVSSRIRLGRPRRVASCSRSGVRG